MTAGGSTLRQVIGEHRGELIDAYVDRLERDGISPAPLPRSELVDNVGELLDEICLSLEQTPTGETERTARKHAFHRWRAGFDLVSLVREYGVLRQLIVAALSAAGRALDPAEILALGRAMDLTLAIAVGEYVKFRDAEKLRQMRELDEARATLDTLLMAAPLGIAFLDRDMRFRLANARLAEMNGVPLEAHLGRTPMDLIPGLAQFVTEMHTSVMRSGQPRTVELVIETPAAPGVSRTFLEHWYPVATHGDIIGTGVIVDDITLRRAAEAFRDRIIGVVSHDLRNPVQAIQTAATLMLQRDALTGDEVRRLAGPILRSVSRMTATIEQLYDYVKLDRGALRVERVAIDLAELARRVIDESRLAFSGREIEVRLEVSGGTRGEWDEHRIAQVLTNLVRNAIQHGDGRAVLRVRGGERAVVVEVENRGRPIAPGAMKHIFEPFHTERREGHLGLGLFITRQVVRAHGGTIDVRSGEDGTVFSVCLPRCAEQATAKPSWGGAA